jgi:hypothetical protein
LEDFNGFGGHGQHAVLVSFTGDADLRFRRL